nr:MAG TPA: Protein of unknown function (DUF1351) [Caudoviricetes sp.]
METTEIRMITDLDKAVPQSLDFNFEEVKAWLGENLTAYRNMVVTEDGIAAAKSDKAKIRKISSAISEQRIAVKKRYLEPYNAFEANMKELSGMCDEASKNIDDQLKKFEEQRKAQKRNDLLAFYQTQNAPAWLTFERIENPRWMNVTFSMDEAQKEITEKVNAVNADVESISGFDAEFADEMLLEYRKTLNVSGAIQRGNELRRMKQERERRRAEQEAAEKARTAEREEAERRHAEAAIAAKQAREADEMAEQAEEPTQEPAEQPEEEPVQILDFRVYVTQKQKIALRDWLKENGIRVTRVPRYDD